MEKTDNTQTLKSSSSGPITYEHKPRQSFKSMMIKFLLRVTNRKAAFNRRLSLKQKNPGFLQKGELPEPPKELLTEFEVKSWKVNDRNVYRFSPKVNKTKKHILYLHGGGYMSNSLKYHWNFVATLIRTYHCTITYPDYPLAPEYTYVESFAMVEPIYKQLVNDFDENNLIIMGDSAGGGFSLALAQKMKNDNIRQPDQIILLSPWLDVTCSNPDAIELEKQDPMLGKEGGLKAAKAYAGNTDLNHYMLSPINGVVEGLGQISIFVGTHETLYADATKFKSICEKKGVQINFFVYPKMIHVWMILGMPESEKAIEQIGDLINSSN